jgi:ribonuclease HII
MEYLIGVDDAGRGPVLGSMFLAGVLIEKDKQEELRTLGAKDSKLLSPATRRSLARKIKRSYKFHIEKSTPKEIDDCDNLNNLEAIKSAMIINRLANGLKGEITAIVDCPSVNIETWSAYLRGLILNQNIKIRAEHKADFNHPVVSAASIIAKETREEEIDKIREDLDIKFGSGYPSDPQTIDFIKFNYKNEKYKDIIRHSWDTVKQLEEKSKQRELKV